MARGIFKEELTYFTNQPVAPGAIVSVTINRRVVDALTIAVKSVAEIKAMVRGADFPLKKILRVKHPNFFSPAFLTAARRAADYFVSPLGLILKSLVPTAILAAPNLSRPTVANLRSADAEKYALQESDEERLVYYKGLVREEFAKGNSVFLMVPTLAKLKRVLISIERGIGDYTFIFHHALGSKKLLESWEKALALKHPILAIGTSLFLSLPRSDIGTLIIDEESSTAYKTFARPFLDYRVFAEMLAEENGWRFILADFVLRTENIYRLERGELNPKIPIKHHAISSAEQKIVQVTSTPGHFRILSEELIEALDTASQNNERFFIFVHRRGLTPLVVCQDCGAAVTCLNCSAPITWHEESLFVCHHCGARRDAAEKCAVCGGWRLIGLGIGIDLVAQELTARLKTLKIFKLDSDETKTAGQAAAVVKKFLATPGSVLIGTEMALAYFQEKIENTAIAAIDSLFALPDYRVNEKIFNLLIRLRDLAGRRFLIQVRNVHSELFELASRGSLLEFYRQELAERREYNYPPFRIFIKITLAGEKNEVLLGIKDLEKKLTGHEFDVFEPKGNSRQKSETALNLLLRLPTNLWPEVRLLGILKSLPPNYMINVDPENLLN